MTAQQRRKVAAIVSSAIFGLALIARILLYVSDVAYGTSLTILTFLVALSAAFASAYGVVWYRGRHHHGAAPPATPEVLAAISGAVAVAVVFFGGLQVVLPNTPQAAAAAACRGIAIAGSAALGQTIDTGANARAGAGSAYPTKDRFTGGCTIGFDGFCVGEPIKNDLTNLPDQRWLIVHSRSEVVSASLIRLQSPQSDLGGGPAPDCAKKYMGVPGATRLAWTAEASSATTELKASAPGAVLIGFAVAYTPAQANGIYPYVNVGYYSPTPGFVSEKTSVTWDQKNSTIPLPNGTGILTMVGEACYADDAPAQGTAIFKRLTFTSGVLQKAENVPYSSSFEGLRRQACSLV